MLVKAGVQLNGLHFLLWYAAAVADAIRRTQLDGREATITSGLEGQHTSGSVHASGLALDLRISDLAVQLRQSWLYALRSNLGNEFFITLESDHIHMQHGFDNVGARGLAEYGYG